MILYPSQNQRDGRRDEDDYASSLDEAVEMAKAMGKESITVIPNGVSVIVKE